MVEAVGERVELGVHLGRLGRQRIEIGDEVAAHPVHVDEVGDLHLLGDHRLFAVDRVDVAGATAPAVYGTPIDAKTLLVEVVAAQQQLGDLLEEEARLGALDDPVVVGRARSS